MSGEAMLRALAAGERVPGGTVLQNARMSAGSRELYGEEEILAFFASHRLGSDLRALTVERLAVLYSDREALFAELCGAHVARLWRLGPGEPFEAEPAISVPSDADLMQACGELLLDPSDHPDLAATDVARLEAAGPDIACAWSGGESSGLLRARSFCLRAFSAGGKVAGLFSVSIVAGACTRISGFVHAAAILDGETLVIRDSAGWDALQRSVWQPRVA